MTKPDFRYVISKTGIASATLNQGSLSKLEEIYTKIKTHWEFPRPTPDTIDPNAKGVESRYNALNGHPYLLENLEALDEVIGLRENETYSDLGLDAEYNMNYLGEDQGEMKFEVDRDVIGNLISAHGAKKLIINKNKLEYFPYIEFEVQVYEK